MSTPLYSVRMRASLHGLHLAGAERIVAESEVSETTARLTARAMSTLGGPPDDVSCRVESLARQTVCYESLPDLSTCLVDGWQGGRQLAVSLLVRAGVVEAVARTAVALLARGAGPGGKVMRGAVIMDAATGERLEADPLRGVRVSRMDLDAECRPRLESLLSAASLGHSRVLEALVLAGKVLHAPGLVAELCWSDAVDYTAGYVADRKNGYQRIVDLKPTGDPRGGRVFFVDLTGTSLQELVHYLERQVVLFNDMGSILLPKEWTPADE